MSFAIRITVNKRLICSFFEPEERSEEVQVVREPRRWVQSGVDRASDVNRRHFVGKCDISSSGDREDQFFDDESVDANRTHSVQQSSGKVMLFSRFGYNMLNHQ